MQLQITINHHEYKKGQIYEVAEKEAIDLLTTGKALRIHRQTTLAKPEKKSKKASGKKDNAAS